MSRVALIAIAQKICLTLLVVTIAILVFGPFGGAEKKFGLDDKEAHVLAFYALTSVAIWALPGVRKWDVAAACLLIGGAIEVVQRFVGRDGNLSDWIADAIGVAMVMTPLLIAAIRNPADRKRRASDPDDD